VRESGHAGRAARALPEHEVQEDVQRQLGHRVAVSEDGARVILYAGTEDAAREAERVMRGVLEQHGVEGDFALDRWHPVEEEWEDASVALPQTPEQRQAEHERLVAEEASESRSSGYAEWEVRVELPSHHAAVELAERLRGEGRAVIRRWKFLVIGVNTEDDAAELAQAIKQEAPAGATVRTEMAGALVPFILF
jgi:hypothetical protein